jgi:hypothetical protein
MGAQDYVLTFARQLLDGHRHPLHNTQTGGALQQTIERVESVWVAAFIWKKQENPLGVDYEWLELLIQRSDIAKNWDLFAGFILRNNGPLETAERAARRSVLMEPGRWLYHSTLATVLERAGKLDLALLAVDQAIDLAVDPWRTSVQEARDRLKQNLRMSTSA